MNAFHCMLTYSEARREGWDHWESIWFVLCDAAVAAVHRAEAREFEADGF
jgi:hypothetical protein